MSIQVRNLDWLRRLQVPNVQAFGARMHELISDTLRGVGTIEQQTNSNASGTPAAPPSLQGMSVVPHENGFDVSIQHEGEFYRGTEYYVHYADNPHFSNARTAHFGQSRNGFIPAGSKTLYFQARAAYPWSDPTPPVFHGGSSPVAVTGGVSGTLLPSQGCGTARAGEPPQGPGLLPFRSVNGAPPVRGSL